MESAAYRHLLGRLEATLSLGVTFGNERMERALAMLGSPEQRLAAIHIAGTNGKGSTAAMTDAILRAAGRKVGLYTSPHLSRFTERIRIDGAEVDGAHLAALGERVFATGVPLTYFEVATVLGFLALAEAGVEVAVLEVGLGGRLDATNVCRPIATAITSIARDHTELLGETIEEIAREKAGIAKAGVPLYLAPVAEEAAHEIARVAAGVGAPVIDVAPTVDAPGLAGAHQRQNAAVARELSRRAADVQGFALTEAAITRGLASVRWPGRLELVAPGVLLDAAHNPEGAATLAAALPPIHPRALVVSIVKGKAADAMLASLAPGFDLVVLTRSSSRRARAPEELAPLVPAGPAVVEVEEPIAAYTHARTAVGAGGLVVVAGSIFLVGQVRAHVLGEPVDPLVTGDPV